MLGTATLEGIVRHLVMLVARLCKHTLNKQILSLGLLLVDRPILSALGHNTEARTLLNRKVIGRDMLDIKSYSTLQVLK